MDMFNEAIRLRDVSKLVFRNYSISCVFHLMLQEYKIELDEGDIIVTATDALFDNLYDQEIVSIASRSLEADKSPQVPMLFLFTFSYLTFYEVLLLFSYLVVVIRRVQLLIDSQIQFRRTRPKSIV